MLISWTPTSVSLGEWLPVQIADNDVVTSLNYRHTRSTGILVNECSVLTSITAPNLTEMNGNEGGYIWGDNAMDVFDCALLETINLSALTEMRTAFVISGCPALTTINFDSLVTVHYESNGSSGPRYGYIQILDCDSITSISFPALTTIDYSTAFSDFQIKDCALLTTISIPSLVVPNGLYVDFRNNALNQATVDHVLARCVANAGYVSGVVYLNGGTNATPSAGGLADKATLAGRGVSVFNN
jgi:hypothetical protein